MNIGLYLHIPFCRSKCPYCDFYSFSGKQDENDSYTRILQQKILSSYNALQEYCGDNKNNTACKADTLYIGGGTPSILGAKNLASLVTAASSDFLTDSAEVTAECNPHGLEGDFFKEIRSSGINRISLGLQSAVDSERRNLGRLASKNQAEATIRYAQSAGFNNISLDIMLGVPGQTSETLAKTLKFCIDTGVPHISAYILKLEENTYFYKNRDRLNLPDDDTTADLYLQMCETLEENGLMQYEISNFAKPGYESRHNLKYWHCEEYLGLGPAAHSFINGKRFYYTRDYNAFINGKPPVQDGAGGDFTEYAMLALRLTEGLSEEKTLSRFGHRIPEELRERSQIFIKNGYMTGGEKGLALTRNGFLLSNSILAEIL